MSDFKFNFTVSDDENDRSEEIKEDDFEEESSPESGPEAREVPWTPAESPAVQTVTTTIQHTFGSYKLVTLASAAAEKSILQQKAEDSIVVKAISGHTDLIAGEYEGGLKVWECCLDLCRYLADGEAGVEGRQVLDLGCGAGLPGLLALKMNAQSVHFQDFNHEVLDTYTMKNVDLNGLNPGSCKFFSGDWSSFASLAEEQNHRYDLILTAETIYNVRSYSKLLKVFSSLLAKGGAVLLAAKNCYIGVGGSIFMFVQYLKKAGPQFTVDTVKEVDAGIPRKVLKLTKT